MPEQLSSENHVAFVKAEGFAQGWLWTSTDSRELPHCREPVGMEVLILASFHPAHSYPMFYPTHLLAQQLLFQYSLCYHLRFVQNWTPWRAELIHWSWMFWFSESKTKLCLLLKKTLKYILFTAFAAILWATKKEFKRIESKHMVLLAQELKWNILWKYFQLI